MRLLALGAVAALASGTCVHILQKSRGGQRWRGVDMVHVRCVTGARTWSSSWAVAVSERDMARRMAEWRREADDG
jgi:hypothetical protein